MKISLSALVFLFSTISILSQNLIVNGTFEKKEEGFAEGWTRLKGTPDHIHLDDTSHANVIAQRQFIDLKGQNRGFMGMVLTQRGSEIFHQQLSEPLSKGEIYELSVKVLAGMWCQPGFELITAAVSPMPLDLPIKHPVKCLKLRAATEQIPFGEWTRVKVIFKAKGNERFITIGNFNGENSSFIKSAKELIELGSEASCNYLIFDDVRLELAQRPTAKEAPAKIILEDFLFASGSFTLFPESAPMLDSIYHSLSGIEKNITITGYTDNVGSVEDNKILSMKRAEAVKASLLDRGFAEDRVTIQGLHELNPIMSNDTAFGRQKNRRVEITIDEE